MLITCERCGTTYVLDDALVSAGGTPVQCTRCQHTFVAQRDQAVAQGHHAGPPPDDAPAAARAPRSRMYVFGRPSSLPDRTQPLAEASRSAEGRVALGGALPPHPTPNNHVMAFSARDFAVPPPPRPPGIFPASEVDRLVANAVERQDDEQALLVVSDALMELGDPRGRLIAFMLQEERASDLMRKVKVNVLIRDHAAQWAPPGATITAFHRGLPSELEWHGPTDPHHVGWRSARAISCTFQQLTGRSLFTVARPRLERLTVLNRALFEHVLSAEPPNLEKLEAVIFNEPPAETVTRARARLPKLAFLTVRSTDAQYDGSLREGPLRAVMQAASELKGLRLSMPPVSFSTLDACLALAPRLEVQFLIPWQQTVSGAAFRLLVDPRRRLLRVPHGVWVDAALRTFLAELHGVLGEELSVMQGTSETR